MKILIWCPLFSLGGGSRLFLHLVDSIARDSRIEKVELIIHEKTAKYIKDKIKNNKIIFKILNNKKIFSWIKRKGRIYGIPGTGFMKRIIRKILNIESIDPNDNSIDERILSELFLNSDCDIIYCFWPHFQKFIETNKPIVCTIQDTIVFEFPESLGAYYVNLEYIKQKEWLIKSSMTVVSSENTKKNIERYFGYFENIEIIRHDSVPDFIMTLNLDINFNSLGNLPEKYIIYPSNISPHKNHYNLLVAYSKLQPSERVPLVFIGYNTDILSFEGDNYPLDYNWSQLRLVGLIKRLGLKKNKDFFVYGFVEDEYVLPLIKNAYALIMPTFSEGGGSYPGEEALALGTPVLCSDIPVMREHLGNRTAKIGWFDPYSVDSIVNSVRDLITKYDEYKKYTLNGMTDMRPSWDSIADRYINTF